MLRRRAGWVLVAVLVSFASFAEPDIVFGIPLKPDPPIAVDGSLGDWVNVPNVIALTDAAQAVWGSGAWRSNEDLSGTARLAWRLEHLYIAVDVVDDVLSQSQRGADLWRGDHVELYLDAAPDLEPDRDSFGAGQFQLAFSPGNFQQTGDPLTDCAPEAYCYRPDSGSIEGALVAAVRTANGYSLEAAIPWRALGIEVPSEGIPFRFELAISDTDSSEARQETLMATSSAEWAHTRSRLRMACLAGTDGVAKPAARELPVFDAAELKQGAKQTFAFDAPPVPEGRIGVLVLMARLHTDAVAGYSQALRIRVNGTAIDAPRMLNKPLRVKSRGGQVYTMAAGDRFSTYYAPDFTSPDTHSYYGLLDGIRPCLFEFDVTDLLKAGENAIEIEHASDNAVQNPMHVADARLAFRMPTPPAAAKAGPPTGPLPVIEPQAAHETRYTAKTLPDNAIEVTVGADTFVVESQFSTPKPEWVHGSCDYFKHERFIEQLPETIVVRDTFTNLSTENLGIMHRYQAQLGDRLKRVWLAGLDQPALSGSTASEQNPTTFAATENGGIGFVALGDVFRIHVNNFAVGGAAGIGDNNLVLKPGGTYTAEWAIVPCETPSYWSFLNATRRLMNVNFTIDGGFAFLRGDPLTEEWTDEQVADFIRFKDPLYVCASITYPRYKGRYTHGTSFQLVDHDNYTAAGERFRRLAPGIKYLVYFHCFLDVTDDGPERFADARTLCPDGSQADYGEPDQRLYIPMTTNSYGAAVAKNVDVILDEIGADGVYWDEHEYSRSTYHFGEPWDGVSGNIDPSTMRVTQLKSSVTLLSEPWRLALAEYIQSRSPLVGNGAPVTKAMIARRFPCFVETGSITNCTQAHCYTPIALGDHLTERSELDAYGTMLAALDYGCVYHWYNDVTVIPTHHHLTRYMFPITPVELHEGYIVGEDRIVTNRNGLYGWGDASPHEAHVFDDTGREQEAFAAPLVTQDGKTYTELRIGEGWSAAILRK